MPFPSASPSPPVAPVSVIVLTWNGRRWIDRCLSTVLAQQPAAADVILVDNASTDDTVEHVRHAYPSVRILSLPQNAGFAAGNNAGARAATTEYLAFLNNDTEVDPGWLAALTQAARADPAAGLVTSRIVYLEDPGTIDSAGDGYLRCGGGFKHAHGQPAATSGERREVFGACGAGFLIRRGLFESLGGFDEDFFMVYEDVDLSYRARLAGARCLYAPGALVHHAGSGSIGRVSPLQVFYGQRNLEWTWIKNSPRRLLWRSCLAHAAYDVSSAIGYARQGHLGTWVRAKWAAMAGLPAMLRKRRVIQRASASDPEALWRLMDPDWIGIKRREKAFDFIGDT